MKSLFITAVLLGINVFCMFSVGNPILSHFNAIMSGALGVWLLVSWIDLRDDAFTPKP